MPGISVSATKEEIRMLDEQAISQTKVFRLGINVIKIGGLSALDDHNNLLDEIKKKDIEIEELKKQVKNLHEELEFLRKKYVMEEKNPDQ